MPSHKKLSKSHSWKPAALDNPGIYRWLKELLIPLKPHFMEAFAISFFVNMLALIVPVFSLQVYDRVVSHNATSTLVVLLLGVLIALCFEFLLRQSRSRLFQELALHLDAGLGRKLYERMTSLPLRVLETRPASYWQSLFQDMAMVRNVFSGPTAMLVVDLPFALLFVIVIFIVAMPVAWVLLIVIAAFLLLTFFSTRVLDLATAKERRKQLGRDGLIGELMHARMTVKALDLAHTLQPVWEKHHYESIQRSYVRGKTTDSFLALGHTLAMLTTVVMVSVGAVAIIDREMTIGALIATTMLTSRIIMPLNQLLSSWRGFASCRQSIHRLERLFNQEGERRESTLERKPPKGQLTLENVSFAYHEDQPVVKDIGIALPEGEVIGIVGRNGSGKTTLLKLMLGLYMPENGRVLLDGSDIRQFSRSELAHWIGYVPQEAALLSGTIRENIAMAAPASSDEAILNAAKLAGADAFISELPDGYATEIGEGGTRLSGGQRQRVAIARALAGNPPLLVLDEVSSHLDTQAEAMLGKVMRKLTPKHTVIMATHSVGLLQHCDKILVMEKGKLAMAGPADKVLEKIAGKPA